MRKFLHKTTLKAIGLTIGIAFAGSVVSAAAPDQGFVEKILRENRYFIEFANVNVSNFG